MAIVSFLLLAASYTVCNHFSVRNAVLRSSNQQFLLENVCKCYMNWLEALVFLYEVSSDSMKKDHLFDINVCAVFNGEIHFHEPADVGLWGGAAIQMMDSSQNSPLLTSSLWHFHPLLKRRHWWEEMSGLTYWSFWFCDGCYLLTHQNTAPKAIFCWKVTGM